MDESKGSLPIKYRPKDWDEFIGQWKKNWKAIAGMIKGCCLTPVKLNVLDPERKDLMEKGKIGKVVIFEYKGCEPMWFRCFEDDLGYVVSLVESCTYFYGKEWRFYFKDNEAYQELVKRKLIMDNEFGIFLALGIGMGMGGGRKL